MTRSVWGLVGVALTTVSATLILTLYGIMLFGFQGGPYQGILAFVILPSFFVMGLLLIPVGVWRQRKLARVAAEKGLEPPAFPIINLNMPRTRVLVLLVLLLTVANVLILALATYKGVEVMDSTEFCGEACHTVMLPELTTYQRSPHARVKCVSCHIGPGADWFVKSKLSGTWQLVAVTLDLHPRPIPTPVHNLRPARETCEQCHWPTKFVGDTLSVRTHYSSDEANTELKTVLLLKVGGLQGRDSAGIHWHVDPSLQIRYRADEKRETIYDVELTDADGSVKTFAMDGEEAPEEAEWRVMDCVDCHNRPTHIYHTPQHEIDEAIRLGTIPRSLPFVRREGLRLLQEEYASQDEARAQMASALQAYYDENHPEAVQEQADAIAQAGAKLGDIYSTNVFPTMKIEWGTYPNHIGHEDYPGCFRCHDDEHVTSEGESISQDCSTCHTVLAWEEEAPEILDQLRP
jgi:hypothetical protein